MIKFISGSPGGGKTLYVVSRLLRHLLGQLVTVRAVDSDESSTVERKIYSNIKGLQMDHEFIDGDSLKTWHTWAKPGAVIVFDEVQKVWPQRAVGSKVPDYIEALETHRHMGVDFILMSQGPHLIDRNLTALIGVHLHIRRIGNMPLAIVYEWDHCSKSLLYRNAMTRKPWRYDKTYYKLYHSADAHTKQPRSVPTELFILGAAVAGVLYLGPVAYSRITDRAFGGAQVAAASKPSQAASSLVALPGPSLAVPALPDGESGPFPPVVAAPVFSGCVLVRSKCNCFDSSGLSAEADQDTCDRLSGPAPIQLREEFNADRLVRAAGPSERDGLIVRSMRRPHEVIY